MKKVTIYFKSGFKISIKCKKVVIDLYQPTGKRAMSIIGNYAEDWSVDLTEIAAVKVKRCWF